MQFALTHLVAAACAIGAPGDDESVLDWDVNGYYRARIARINGLPRKNPDFLQRKDIGAKADYGFMRLRLEPSLKYGPNPKLPIAALYMQIDGLDNVVFGDNDLIADTPVFGDILSATDINAIDIDTLQLRRAWLEFLVPVGLMRVGRMASNWGLGLLANGGDGLTGDFGDPLRGSTTDRILFATRPLTIYNVLAKDDDRVTPLILVAAYDKIVEDPHLEATDFRYDSEEPPRGVLPFVSLSDRKDDVQQVVFAVVWNDKKFNKAAPQDELTLGTYFTHRWQTSSESKVSIGDLFWRFKYSFFGKEGPQLFSEGEVLTIQGTSRAISAGTLTEPNIWGGAGRIGALADAWDAVLEAGHASGDAVIADEDFTSRPLNADHRVGLVMFPIVLNARTANQFSDNPSLWSRGGVYNATYLYPHGRYRPFDGVEVVGAVLLAWADELTPVIGGSQRDDGGTSCGAFAGDCFLGVEGDLAVKIDWGPDDLLRWSTEVGLMKAGKALETVLSDDLIWTLQSRIAMVF